jgi:hypothetical protein
MKRFKNIVLKKKKTTIEIKDVDGWLFDLRYIVNGKVSYSSQIIKTDIPRRVERLKEEGYVTDQK